MSHTQIEAEADAEMDKFLAGMKGEQPQPPAEGPKEDELDESQFAVDDEGEEETPSQSQVPSGSGDGTGQLPSQQPPSQQPPAQAPTMYTPEQLEYERRLAEERGRNAAMTQMMQGGAQHQQPEHQGPAPLFDPSEIQLTDDEINLYGKDATAYAEKIAKRVMQQVHEKAILPLQQQIYQQQQALNQSRVDSATQQSQLLFQRVQAAVPELPQITQSQEWRNYLNTPAPGTGGAVAMRTLLETNIRQGNFDGIKEIVDIYLDRSKQSGLQSQVSPGRSQVSNPPSTLATRKPRQLAYSKFLSARNQYASGQMSYDEFSRIEAVYDKAAVEDRINYDK